MKFGFTGTRDGMSSHQKEQLVVELEKHQVDEFHHGDCLGADAEAHDIIRLFYPDCKIVIHPPKDKHIQAFKKGDEHREPDDYLVRDRKIVNETDFLIGAPLINEEQIRSGTWATIRHARRTNKPHIILER